MWMLKSLDINFFVQLSPKATRKSFSNYWTYSGLLNSSGVHFYFWSEIFLFSLFPGLNRISCSSSTVFFGRGAGACGGFAVPLAVYAVEGLIDLFKLEVVGRAGAAVTGHAYFSSSIYWSNGFSSELKPILFLHESIIGLIVCLTAYFKSYIPFMNKSYEVTLIISSTHSSASFQISGVLSDKQSINGFTN